MRNLIAVTFLACMLFLSACSVTEEGGISFEIEAVEPTVENGEAVGEETDEVLDGDLVDFEVAFSTDYSDIDPADADGFVDSIAWGDTGRVQAYIEAGANVDAPNQYGSTPLSTAVVYENAEIVQILLDHGANINYQNGYYLTALIDAIDMDSVDMVNLLISNGADVNIGGLENQDYYPIIAATLKNNAEIVSILLENGAYPNVAYVHEEEPVDALWLADTYGYDEIVTLLEAAQ